MSVCAPVQAQEQEQVRAPKGYIPMSSTYADFTFTLTSGSRLNLGCAENADCPVPTAAESAVRFSQQVQRVAAILQDGALQAYPDMAQRVPGLAGGRFDVYVVAADKPGSSSSANGRIALDAALGDWQPYDDWIAFVIAREMGHVIARHHEENSTAGILTSVLMNILLPGSSLLKSAISAGASSIAAKSKREVQAREADAIAFKLLRAGGFRLHEVALSLRLAPALPDDGAWARAFMASADQLNIEVDRSELAVATLE